MSLFGIPRNSTLSSRNCNGDVQEPNSDDEIFVNSRLGLEGYDRHQSLFLELEEAKFSERIKYNMSPLFSPLTPQNEQDAIIFSVNFCGKNFGELGLFEPDISVLDWEGFKTYLYSSLNLENSDSLIISYEDDEGDKIPIQSQIEYIEALRIAKDRSLNREKFNLNINRTTSSSFPRTLRSLMTSSLRRVNSVGGNRHAPPLPKSRSITTSTSFIDLRNRNFEIVDVKSDNYTPDLPDSLTSWGQKTILPIRLVLDFDKEDCVLTRLYNCVNDSFALMNYTVKPFDKINYNKNCFSNPFPIVNTDEEQREVSYQLDLTCLLSQDQNCEAPMWFQDSMQKMKTNVMNDISSKMNENFQDFFGSFMDINQDKFDFCCKGHKCSRQGHLEAKREEEILHMRECQEKHLKEIQSLHGLKTKIEDNQAQLFAYIQNSNEEIKQKLCSGDLALDQYTPNQEQGLYIEERERVLSRIKGCSQRQTMSSAINASDNVKKLLNSPFIAPASMNAKFCEDENYPDGSLVLCGQKYTKTWKIINNGIRAWSSDVKLVCLHHCEVSPRLIPIQFESTCPPLAPGEQGVVSIDFLTPNTPGLYMNKWCFKMNGCQFGDILWCSIEALKEHVPKPSTQNGTARVLKTILNLLMQERPDFDDASECRQELDLVMNYFRKSNLNSYLAIKSFLHTSPTSESRFLDDRENIYDDQESYADGSGPLLDTRSALSGEYGGNKEDRGTPETEEAVSHHFPSQRMMNDQNLITDRDVDPILPVQEFDDRDESDYCDSHSEINNSDDDEEDYQSDPLELDELEGAKTAAVLKSGPLLANNTDREEPMLDEVYQESETENDYEGTDDQDEEGTEDEDELITESESEIIEEAEARRLESTSRSWTDKKFTLREDNFKQNVQVKLDFEVITKPPVLQTSASASTIQSLSHARTGPLTFREQHFTTSGCSILPPPRPVQVPESDDDFDGVFIPEDGPRSNRSELRDDTRSKDDDSSSTSSFSECDDDDVPVPSAAAPVESPTIPDRMNNSAGDVCKEGETSTGDTAAVAEANEIHNPNEIDLPESSTNDSKLSERINFSEEEENETKNIANELNEELNKSSKVDVDQGQCVVEPENTHTFTGEDNSVIELDSSLADHGNSLAEQDNSTTEHDSSAVEHDNSMIEQDKCIVEHDSTSPRLVSSDSGTTSTSPTTLLEVNPSSSDSLDPPITDDLE